MKIMKLLSFICLTAVGEMSIRVICFVINYLYIETLILNPSVIRRYEIAKG